MQLRVLFAFFYRFVAKRFRTLKFESDFFSRQGYWTLYWTVTYHGILLKEKQRLSSFYFL